MIGKVSPEDLAAYVFSRTGAADPAVVQGPAYGEDTAAIDIEEAGVLVVNQDPISLAVERLGTLGVHVACNDVAASGARPRWLAVAVFLPGEREAALEALDAITRQLDETADGLGVAVVGGHSEYAPGRDRPLLVLTCLGLADEYVPTGGAAPGDRVLLVGTAGIEATAILATDFRDRLADAGVPGAVLDRARTFYGDVSVVEPALAVAEHATGMHDPTEGGVLAGLVELAGAAGVGVEVERDAIPVREETARVCAAMGVDPLATFGSGALLVTVPEDDLGAAEAALADVDAAVAEIGRVIEADNPRLVLDGTVHREAVRDELYQFWE